MYALIDWTVLLLYVCIQMTQRQFDSGYGQTKENIKIDSGISFISLAIDWCLNSNDWEFDNIWLYIIWNLRETWISFILLFRNSPVSHRKYCTGGMFTNLRASDVPVVIKAQYLWNELFLFFWRFNLWTCSGRRWYYYHSSKVLCQ